MLLLPTGGHTNITPEQILKDHLLCLPVCRLVHLFIINFLTYNGWIKRSDSSLRPKQVYQCFSVEMDSIAGFGLERWWTWMYPFKFHSLLYVFLCTGKAVFLCYWLFLFYGWVLEHTSTFACVHTEAYIFVLRQEHLLGHVCLNAFIRLISLRMIILCWQKLARTFTGSWSGLIGISLSLILTSSRNLVSDLSVSLICH